MQHKELPLQPQDPGSPRGHAAGPVGPAHDAELQLLRCGERWSLGQELLQAAQRCHVTPRHAGDVHRCFPIWNSCCLNTELSSACLERSQSQEARGRPLSPSRAAQHHVKCPQAHADPTGGSDSPHGSISLPVLLEAGLRGIQSPSCLNKPCCCCPKQPGCAGRRSALRPTWMGTEGDARAASTGGAQGAAHSVFLGSPCLLCPGRGALLHCTAVTNNRLRLPV